MASLTSPTSLGDPPVAFADRREAGRQLAQWLRGLGGADPVVVALPRGGVPVAEEISFALGAPLEVLVVRKLGAPANPEYGIGAIAEGGTRVIDPEITQLLGVRMGELERTVLAEEKELQRRVRAYRGEDSPPDLGDRTVIVVDDGVATGATDVAAVRAVRAQSPRSIVVAVPVCSREGYEVLRREADEVVSLIVPSGLGSVARYYRDFAQVSDQEVIGALHRGRHAPR